MSSKNAVPYFCPKCKAEGEYYGRLLFPDEEGTPMCPYHRTTPLVSSERGSK